MITNRSNHIPMLMKIVITNSAGMLVRTFFDQSSCGMKLLQATMMAAAHQ